MPVILDALTAIVAKKPAFQALPLGGVPALVKQDLGNLSASTEAFENALIASTPARIHLAIFPGSVMALMQLMGCRPASKIRPSNSRPPSMQPSLTPLQLMLKREKVLMELGQGYKSGSM